MQQTIESSFIDTDYVSPLTAEAYLQMYRDQGQQLVIKASGRELTTEKLRALVPQIEYLTANGIYTVLVYGGGEQITQEWKDLHPGVDRPKVNGVGITTDEVRRDAVRPAYEKIRRRLQDALPDFLFFNPEDMPCDRVESVIGKDGQPVDPRWVGKPRGLVIPQGRNVAIGFMGMMGKEDLNVNADWIARGVGELDQTGEIFFLTETRGVLDRQKNVVPVLLANEIRSDGGYPGLDIDGGMGLKTLEVKNLLAATRGRLQKVVFTDGAGLRREIEDWRGGGTLVFDPCDLECSPATAIEHTIVDTIDAEYEEQGLFRRLMPEGKERARRERRVVRIGNSPMGGFSLLDHPSDNAVEFARYWAGYPGNGIGKHIVGHAQRQFGIMGRNELFALSAPLNPSDETSKQKLIELYQSYGFQCRGKVSEFQGKDGVPHHVSAYDPATRGRDPYYFIYKRPGS